MTSSYGPKASSLPHTHGTPLHQMEQTFLAALQQLDENSHSPLTPNKQPVSKYRNLRQPTHTRSFRSHPPISPPTKRLLQILNTDRREWHSTLKNKDRKPPQFNVGDIVIVRNNTNLTVSREPQPSYNSSPKAHTECWKRFPLPHTASRNSNS